MKFAELKNKDKNELREMLRELAVKLGKLRFDLGQNNLKDSSQIGKTKKDTARILTALSANQNKK